MLKWCLVLSLLTQRSLISSEEEVNEQTENPRATRQLNFGECCPCTGQDAFQDQDSPNSNVESNRRSNGLDHIRAVEDDSCPCRSISDSESSSSIFRPAFRNVEPFVRPVSKKEPKPLLNPEVGLASSVLETLREVTDQEYQEALMRDVARDALQFMDSEQPEAEPRNEVNILSLKEENNDDIISDATEVHLQLQPPKNLLNKILTSPKLKSDSILNTNHYDTDDTTSETQERREKPLKNKLLENMKTRLNLLNLRPFPNTDSKDLVNSPSILQKNSLKNNIRDHIVDVGDKEKYMEPNEVSNFDQDSNILFDNSAMKMEASAENKLLQTTSYTKPNISFKDDSEDIDVVPLPSSPKAIEVIIQDIEDNPIVIIQENEANTDVDTDIINNDALETVTEPNNLPNSIEAASETITEDSKVEDVQTNDSEITYVTENLNDMESEANINKNIVSNLQDATNSEFISATEDESELTNTYPTTSKDLRDQISLSSISSEKTTVGKKTISLPNIKADIYRTLENFKKANEKIQEKLRSNVQDALQLVDPQHTPSQIESEPKSEIRASSGEQLKHYVHNVTNSSEQKIISTQDLQEMSDSLLELNSLKDNAESSTKSGMERNFIESLENKTAKVEKVSDVEDMITSPTYLNEKYNMINLQDEKSILNVNNQHTNSKNDETVRNLCPNNFIPRLSDSSITTNENNEMTAQPSNSVLQSISQRDLNPSKLELLQRDYIVEPEDNAAPIEGIKDLFNRYRALSADHSRTDYSDSAIFDNQPLLRYKNDKNIDSSKSFSGGNTSKLDSNSNISSYKAKVASPKSLDINPLKLTTRYRDDEDVLGFASQNMPQTTNLQNVVKNNFDNGLNLFKRIQTPKMLHDTFSSINPGLSESFTSHTNNAFKSFRDSLDVVREPFTIRKNNLLGKSLINPDHLLGAAFKTHEDFNDKLHAIHSDLNRRLSSISSGISHDSFPLLWPSDRLKNFKNRAELHNIPIKNTRTKPAKTKTSIMKNTLLSRNIPSFESNKKKPTDSAPRSNKADILRSNIKEKLGLLPHQKNLGYKKEPFAMNPTKSLLTTKQPPKGHMKLKPLKENKVTISFATTSIRPDTLKSSFKPSYQVDSVRSRSADGLSKLPKLSKILEDKKRPNLNSKLKSNEPKGLASEISMSRAALPGTEGLSKVSEEASSLEGSERSHDGNLQRYEDIRSEGLSEGNKRKPLLLSKLKNSFATGITTDGTNRNDKLLSSRQKDKALDATQSASNNIDTSISATSLLAATSKDNNNNQSFKCKMVCIHDLLDSTDTYQI